MRSDSTAFLVAAFTMAVACRAEAQDFQWRGQLGSGQTIEVKGVNGDVRAAPSSSGDVEVTATRTARRSNPADASTVNGAVDVAMGRADWPDGATFKSVNGGITLRLPVVVDADLRAETLNGSISADFPITVTGPFSPRRLNGTIGNGGRPLTL